ncbi:MAG: hypothetical protein ACLPVI_03955 [Dehalococcoidales bacterium]
MIGKTKKATFSLHTDVLAELDQVMAQGKAASKNALVEQALIKEFNELRRQTRKNLWREASKDQLLLNDIAEVETDFKYADSETTERKN